ncbi:hypothetical protein D3C78_1625820 [compost metagenome]
MTDILIVLYAICNILAVTIVSMSIMVFAPMHAGMLQKQPSSIKGFTPKGVFV